MNLGGEPERDDSGLPPVDIVVPDDARELDRDVQAYRRELRALRRHQRRMRWHGPLTRDGVILPLLASCLVLALIAGTLLTFFTARPGGEPAGGRRPAAAASSRASGQADSPPATVSPHAFPADITLTMDGVTIPRGGLTDHVFALVPSGCACSPALTRLVKQAAQAGVSVFLIGGAKLATVQQIRALAVPANLTSVQVAQDARGTLASTYLTASETIKGSAPTVLLVAANSTVSVAPSLPAGFRLNNALAALSDSAG